MNRWIPLGALFSGLGVILGAMGAHSLKDRLTEQKLAAFHTATDYLLYHGLALLLVGILTLQLGGPAGKKLNWVGGLFTTGIVLFCGSIYILTFGGPRAFGPMTPLGGLSFMTGWFALAFICLKKND